MNGEQTPSDVRSTDEQFVFTDRYQALGIPYPSRDTVCLGHCEGVGFYPERDQTSALWQEAHREGCTLWGRIKRVFSARRLKEFQCDGWHFVKCPDCGGTGKRK